MYSDDEKVVLCGASAYEQKYYFNQDFASLPQSVQDELHIMCVMFTVEIGGISPCGLTVTAVCSSKQRL